MEKLSGTVKALRVNARNQRNWSREKSMQLLLITCILNVVNEFTKLLDFRWGKDVLVDNFISRHLYLYMIYYDTDKTLFYYYRLSIQLIRRY